MWRKCGGSSGASFSEDGSRIIVVVVGAQEELIIYFVDTILIRDV
jgi:hypothetical protein